MNRTTVNHWPQSGTWHVSGMGDAALQYITWGFRVLALHTPIDGRCDCYRRDCDSVGKHPRTKHGVLDATTDPATVRQWFTWWPFANIGIATTDLVVIDVDPPGLSAWQEVSRSLELRTTRTARTGSGGLHLMYTAPAGVTVGNSSGRLPSGIDVRGNGGYIVAPPSLHATGIHYTNVGTVRDVMPAPSVLLRLLEPIPTIARPLATCPSTRPFITTGSLIAAGDRNRSLFRVACAMRRKGMGADEMASTLSEVNASRCNPPVSDFELDKIARSAARYQEGA